MSEIKGQMLGMVLVLMIFSVVGAVLYGSFKKEAAKISSQLEDPTSGFENSIGTGSITIAEYSAN